MRTAGRLLSSLRVRLILLVLLAGGPAFGLLLWTNLEQRRDDRAAAQASARQLTDAAAAQEAQVIANARDLLRLLSVAPEVTGSDLMACHEYLVGVVTIQPRYSGIGVTNLNGDISCSSVVGNPYLNVADRAYFQRVLDTGEFSLGDYVLARDGRNTPVLSIAYPMFDSDGGLAGMVATGVTLDWLNEFPLQISLPEGATVTVIDRSGVVLGRYPDPDDWVGRAIPEAPLLSAILTDPKGTAETTGLDGVERLYTMAPLDGSPFSPYVAAGVPTASLYAAANEALARNVALLTAALLLTLVIGWFASERVILRGVHALLGASQRVAAGDLSARTGLPHGAGEVNQLAHSFDEMAAALEQRDRARRRAEADLQEQAEELARSNAELEQFAYVASHDLQEPLRMVANYTQLLARRYQGKLDRDADEFIGYAVDGASRMQTLINDLLAFSRVSTRGRELASVDAEAALKGALLNLTTAIEQSGAAVTHGPLPQVLGDEAQLAQLFQNLIGNAIKFRGKEPPRIHVSAEPDGAGWRFAVRDNGIGIDPAYGDRIFVLFQRLHPREQYPGTGIGLAICKKVVERHGGRIWFESRDSAGATFMFTLRGVSAAPVPERLAEVAG